VLDAAADWQRDVARAPMHFTRLSDEEEIRIGETLAAQYATSAPQNAAEFAATELYVNRVGERVAARAHRRLPFRFHLVADTNLINAFALPGGHVFVGQGLLDRMTSEDELAFVLGHEIEHIDHYHAVERVQLQAQLKNLNLDLVAALAELPISLWEAGYSKDEELEADREGLRLAVAAGYSAQGALKMLERWTRLHSEYVIHAQAPIDELSEVAIEGLQGYFRSHPLPSERLAQARQVIAQDRLDAAKPLTPFRVEYEITGGGR
jgi:predicted Zn-dependent protease